MLIDLSQAVGSYLHEVFVAKFQWWVLLGYVAQIMFTMRFLVQWIASERAGRSVVPMAFWVFSIGGGVLLFVYALYRRDPVFILGQGLGVFIYLRNLYFVLRDGTRDTGCGLKAFRRDLFLALPYFDGLHRFLPALVRREGYDIGYVDVVDRPRRFGTSNYGMWDRLWVGILDLFGVWWLIRRRKRVPQASEV